MPDPDSVTMALRFGNEVVDEPVAILSCDHNQAAVWTIFHLLYESFALQGDRCNEQLRRIEQRSHVIRKAPRETFHLPDFVDHDEPRSSVSEVKFSQELLESGDVHSIAAHTIGSRVVDVGQDQSAAAERHKAKAFSGSLRVPDFFCIESRRLICRQALGECANQRGLADSR